MTKWLLWRKLLDHYVFLSQLGEIGSRRKSTQNVQDFYKIRDECLEQGTLWEDPDFEAVDSSITFKTPPRQFEWRRPGVSGEPVQ